MTIASGIRKISSYKKQTGLGVLASGSGGKQIRRRTTKGTAPRDTYQSDEIVSHHQSTGVTYGLKRAEFAVDGLVSPGTYADLIGSILERDFAAVTPITGVSLTIAASGSNWTVTRAAGSFLTDGVKNGDVIRLTGGSLSSGNVAKNLVVLSMTATILTVRVLNASALTAEGPIASCTVTVTGKKTYVPYTGHVYDYYTVEDWYADISRSEVFGDCRVGGVDIGMPATGNGTFASKMVGLSRALAGAQVLTSPTVTTTNVVNSSNGLIVIHGTEATAVTGITVNIANTAANAGAVIGSNSGQDVTTGRIMVSGSFTAQFDAVTFQTLFDNETNTSITAILAVDETANSDFVQCRMSRVKITSDDADDGEKAIVRTYNFTAEINTTGGSGTSEEQTIISFQDSAA